MTRPLPQKSAASLWVPGMSAVALGPPLIVMTVPGPADGATVVDGDVTRIFVGLAGCGTPPAWQTGGAERPNGYR